MSTLSTKIEYVFNKIALSFIKEIKDKDVSIKTKISEHYKPLFDTSSDEHINFFMTHIKDSECFMKSSFENNIIENDNILESMIFKDITVSNILDVVDDNEKNVVKCYLYDLYMLSYLYKMNNEKDGSVTTELLNKAVRFVDNKQNFVLEDELDNVFDDELRIIFQNIYETKKDMNRSLVTVNPEIMNDMGDFSNVFEFLNNSKIGSLAKEISQDIDISHLHLEKPEDLLNMDSVFSGDNPVLGDIIGKVSSRISSKIECGDLKQDELMQEALSMMSKLNGVNPMMDEMMKSAMNQHGPNLKSGKRRNKK
jgi:hypothetical protein